MHPAPSIEQDVKRSFAREFVKNDWTLFKSIAEFYFQSAVFLKTADVKYVAPNLRLLTRNSQKRLYIGIGAELLLKAIYLKHGFLINRLKDKQIGAPDFPFTAAAVKTFTLTDDKTYMFDELIDKLKDVPALHGSTARVVWG